MLKDDKAMLVLFKSKQQMISMVDLSQEPLKVEQHSSNVIVVLDSQGRAWSLQILDENFIKTFPYHLLPMRYSVLSNQKIVSFSIDKGENKNPVKIGNTYHAEIFGGSDCSHMKMIEMKKVKVEPNVSMWHHNFTNYNENGRLLLYGAKNDFTDVPMKGIDTDCIYLMIKLNGKVSPAENEVLINKMEKIGKNVMMNMNNAEKIVKPQTDNIESQIGSNADVDNVNHKVDSKSRDVKLENPTRENIKNIEAPVKVSTTNDIPNLKMSKDFRDTDMIHMLMSEFRLQNTEMRISMLKLHDKIDQMGIPKPSEKSVVVDHPVDHAEVQIKKAMNRLYKHIKTEIRPSEEYNGQDILDLVASCIKSTTESILENKANQ